MNNPCSQCLVKACCRQVCDEKTIYIEWAINELVEICKLIYDEAGAPRINVAEAIKRQHDFACNRCEINSRENQNIFNRYLGHQAFD